MAVQLLKYTTVRSCKLLLLFLIWNEVAVVNGNGSESPTHDERNYPKDNCIDEDNQLNTDKDKHNLPFNIGNSYHALNLVKRTPSGFTGMRGKKEYGGGGGEFINNYNKETPNEDDNAVDWSIDPLRQESYESELNSAYGRLLLGGLEPRLKKAPSTFYGVRGKKYAGSDLQRIDAILQRLEAEALRQDIFNYLLQQQTLDKQNDLRKRAPTGFTGMRGKRPSAVGVIDYLYGGGDGGEDMWPLPMLDNKRGPVNGFMGVRGKKDVDHQAFKRSPAEMSGRRSSKSQRFVDFSNKFVAVRGKKSDADSDSNTFADVTYQRYSSNNNNMPLLSQQLGLRGKRAAIAMRAETDRTSPELAAVEDLRAFNN